MFPARPETISNTIASVRARISESRCGVASRANSLAGKSIAIPSAIRTNIDLLQEAFLRLARHARKLAEDTRLGAWLVRILGAVAAGGYVASRTQIAVLGAVTDQASADATVGGQREPLVVAPLSAWGAGREEQQVVASLRSAAVLRWELRPGSIVWLQARGGVPEVPTQTLHQTVPELFTQPAVHTLAVKLSWWFG